MGIREKFSSTEATPEATPSTPAPAAAAGNKTVEAWAVAKGHATNERGQFLPGWQFGAARAVEGWGEGRELSEAQYDAAVSKALGARINSGDLIERK